MNGVIVLFEARVHLVEQLFAVAAEYFVRRHVPEVAKLDCVRQNSGVSFNRVKKCRSIRWLRISKRPVEIKEEAIEIHGGLGVLVSSFWFLVSDSRVSSELAL